MRFVYWTFNDKHTDYLNLSIASVRKLYPSAEVVLYAPATIDADVDTRKSMDALWLEPPMVANLKIQFNATFETEEGEPIWFLDTDVLVHHPLPSINEQFVVTWRDDVGSVSDAMPYNYGVMGAYGSMAVATVFSRMIKMIQTMPVEQQNWYGNQLALAKILGNHKPGDYPNHIKTDVGDVDLRVLACETWNYSPNSPNEDFSKRAVIHLKGPRKQHMRPIAEKIGVIDKVD